MPSSRFSGFLHVLISQASKMRRLRQLALVRRILDTSQETVWPERKRCSAKADFCECLCSTTFWCSLRWVENLRLVFEPSIQFTVERETNRKISFPDVTVCRQDNGRLSTKVYRKPTHTERYLSFHSHHPVAHKKAVVKSLTNRAKIIPSSSDQRSNEMKHVTAALVADGYPKRFVIDVGKPKWLAQQLN